MRASIVLSNDFLTAFATLPSREQRGVQSLISRFTQDSTASGLNYERVRRTLSPNIRSLRISKAYRAIVYQPPRSGQHLLLWAAKHDEAYKWAQRHRCDINSQTGAIQVYEPKEPAQGTTAAEKPASRPEPTGPFAPLRRRQLVRLGIPDAMAEEVRSASGEADEVVKRLQQRLPREGYEALIDYACGESYESIIRDREVAKDPVDDEDFETALQRDDSRAQFVVISSQNTLEAVLKAPLEKWRVFLHPRQRKLVERHWNGPVRVLGAAGTGKTVVAMHRARWLAERAPAGRKVLFVTFNRNLASDIRQNLLEICKPDEMDRIEVVNIAKWVHDFLKRQPYEQRIVYSREPKAWKVAMTHRPDDIRLPEDFYRTEWEQVVQLRGVSSLGEYKKVSRIGRGTALSRKTRIKIWRVFDAYRQELARRGIRESGDAVRDACDLIRAGNAMLRYSSVVVDEAQDLDGLTLRLIRSLVPEGKDDLFIAGDCHQRIYGHKTVLGRCGINIRGRSHKLRLNYRTTEQTRAWAARLLAGRDIDDLDGGTDDNSGIHSLTSGPEPLVRNFATEEEQWQAVVNYLKSMEQGGADLRDICVMGRVLKVRDSAREAIRNASIPAFVIERDGDDRAAEGVRLATMHRVKGLEFDRVVVVSANKGLLPHSRALDAASDAAEREAIETKERALVYVAASRAKKELLVFSHGKASSLLGTADSGG